MAETVYAVMKLLMFCYIRSGVNGEEDLIFLKRTSDAFPCDKAAVCYDIWHFNPSRTSDYIVIVHNAEIQTSNPEDDSAKCSLRLTVDDGHIGCQKNPDIILAPGETFSQRSACDATLTVALQSPASRRFKCQVAADEQVQTSEELWIRVPGPTGRGRGLILKPKDEREGHNLDMIGAAAGAVGCLVLTAHVAAFVVNRRRTRNNNQMANNSCNVISVNSASDDVIYADITLPAGSDRMWLQECESTEYACVNYK